MRKKNMMRSGAVLDYIKKSEQLYEPHAPFLICGRNIIFGLNLKNVPYQVQIHLVTLYYKFVKICKKK